MKKDGFTNNLKLAIPVAGEQSITKFLTQSGTFKDGDLRVNKDGVRIISQLEPEFLSPIKPVDDQLSLWDLDMVKVVGKGSNGYVQLVQHKWTGQFFALKVIQLNIDKAILKAIAQELKINQSSQCPYLVTSYQSFYDNGTISLILEYMDGGSLADFLKSVKAIPESYLSAIFRQVLQGLIYLHHDRHIIHRDLKPSNLLINHRGEVKITDFSASIFMAKTAGLANTFVGTYNYNYMSPERIGGSPYSSKSDIWSLGLVVLECATGKFPYAPPNQKGTWTSVYELMDVIVETSPPALPSGSFSPELSSFISTCLQKDPNKRSSAKKLMEHPFLNKYDYSGINLASYFTDAGSPLATLGNLSETRASYSTMPSPSASPISKSKYDVFLSFRGEDTRHSIVSHLYAALSSRGIVTFKDDKRLEIGDHISDELHRAIEGSDFVVVVLSENYATSRWCLMELQLIMELHMERRLDVIPVFYRVEPSDVRHQLGSFDLQRYQDDPQMADKVPRWREALKLIADLSGVESKLCIDEATMVGKIAKDMIVKAKVKHFDIVGTKSMAEREVDVFLSYSCKTDETEHFEYHLVQNGTTTHKSYSYLERRVIPMDQCTFKALEHVKVAVVVISDTKPCSVGFLEELKVILDFEEKGSLTVIPIFLTPTRVDDVSEKIFQEYPENAPSWRTALTKLAKIASKYPFSQGLAGEELPHQLKQIAHDIFLLLLSSISNDFNGLVAMDRHMKVVYDLLASKANKEVHTIGIWGSAGVGKTTLARYIYAEISVNFQTNVFLKDVKNLREKILKFEGDGDPTVIISSDYNGHEITQARCKHRKVLLIADDVKNIEQGKWIIEYANWFAPGSRVILISQTKNLLVDAGVKHAYEVRSLRYDEALQLFSHFAFKQPDPPSDFEQLAVRAVHLARFLPLALRLLGSFLNGRDRKEWVAALVKLKAKQGGNIMEVWKLMEPSGAKGQEEWETAADIMERKESSQDKGQEEREVASDIMEGKESSQDKGQGEREVASDIMEGKESSQDKGQEEREVASDIMKGKESSQDKT